LHLPEQGADDEHRRHAADLVRDLLPGPAFLALDIEDLLGELFTSHWISSLACSVGEDETVVRPLRGRAQQRLQARDASLGYQPTPRRRGRSLRGWAPLAPGTGRER